METSLAPSYYLPPGDVPMDLLDATDHTTYCEWKGEAAYFTVRAGDEETANAAWTYPDPDYAELADHVSFYPQLVECLLDGEPVRPQPGHFYGGWVTSDVTGPFKGAPGTQGW